MNPFANLYGLVVDFFRSLLDILFSISGNYAAAIILMTIGFNLILLPMRVSQSRGMKVQKLLQPQIDAINAKYKDDKERASSETMALWKANDFNPLSGCLPTLMQLPLLFALIEVFRNITFPEGPASTFFWIENISQGSDPILTIIVGIACYLQTLAMSSSGPVDNNMKTMNYLMPLLMVYMCWSQPPSLSLYWATNQLFYGASQYAMGRLIKVEIKTTA